MRLRRLRSRFLLACLVAALAERIAASSPWTPPTNKTDWAGRVIYQVLVDRFSRNGEATTRRCPSTPPTCTFNTYTGGTWLGVTDGLDYIQDLGADAVWFTPISEQTGGRSWEYPDGYHGYWPRDLYATNGHFGMPEQLQQMIDAMHARGMWAMLDVVANHVGYGPRSAVAIFNHKEDYHSCDGCAPGCGIIDGNEGSMMHCQQDQLPDLNHSVPYVAEQLMAWHKQAYLKWHIDGYRVDMARHIDNDWLVDLTNNISIFTLGEWGFMTEEVVSRMRTGALDSSLNYLLWNGLKYAFGEGDMQALRGTISRIREGVGPEKWEGPQAAPLSLMGNYVDSHDDGRFLCKYNDIRMYENAQTYVLFAEGIPIIYYGAELGMHGMRDPFWMYGHSHHFRDDAYKQFEIYKFLHILIGLRTAKQVWQYPFNMLNVTGPYASSVMAFERAGVIVVLNSLRPSVESQLSSEPVKVQLSGIADESGIIGQQLNNALFGKGQVGGATQEQRLEPVSLTVSLYGTGEVTLSPGRWPLVFSNITTQGMVPYTPYPQPTKGVGADGWTLIAFCCVSVTLAIVMWSVLAGGLPCVWVYRHIKLGDNKPAGSGHELNRVDRGTKAGTGAGIWAALRSWSYGRSVKPAKSMSDSDQLGDMEQGDVSSVSKAEIDAAKAAATAAMTGLWPASAKLTADEVTVTEGGDVFVVTEMELDAAKSAASAALSGLWAPVLPTAVKPSKEQELAHALTRPDTPGSDAPEEPSTPTQSFTACESQTGSSSNPLKRSTLTITPGCTSPLPPATGTLTPLPTPAPPLPTDSNNTLSREIEVLPPISSPSHNGAENITPAKRVTPSPTVVHQLMPSSSSYSSHTPSSARLPPAAVPDIHSKLVLHVAMEYTIPHLGYNTQFMFGGLGKVVDTFLREWQGPVGLCSPLYAEAYDDHVEDSCPKFLAPGTLPALSFNVSVRRRQVAVQLFLMQHENITYFFIQSDIFRHRVRGTIYTFEEEGEMLTWISVMGQATSVIISTFAVERVQFHDWHGTLSLMYLPVESRDRKPHRLSRTIRQVRPAVLLVLHNAHYNGTFPVPTQKRRAYVYGMFELDEGAWAPFLEHKGEVDLLHGAITWLSTHQHGLGAVAVSERYAKLIKHKLDFMWQLHKQHVVGIRNALPLTNCLARDLAAGTRTLDEIIQFKAQSKVQFQTLCGLATGDPNNPFTGPQLVAFLGRMTHQKGCDIIAMTAPQFLQRCPQVQLVMVGPVGDKTGAQAQARLVQVAQQFPGRVYAPPGKYFSGQEKALLLAAADFCLVPSRFEPCGLVDIEFGWHGALMIGHNTGGLGKMPGIYYEVQSSARKHLAACLTQAVEQAMDLRPDQRRLHLAFALAKRFSTEEMMRRYAQQWAAIEAACKAEQAGSFTTQDRALLPATEDEAFFSKLWREHNVQDIEAATQTSVIKKAHKEDDCHAVHPANPVSGGRQDDVEDDPHKHQHLHNISYYLLLLMQAFSHLPMLLVAGFAVHTYIGFITIEGCQSSWDASFTVFPYLHNTLAHRMLTAYIAYAVAAPVWTMLAMVVQPRMYVLLLAWMVLLAAGLAQMCASWTVMINPVIVITSLVAPMGLPLMSLNFLGKSLEVSEKGLKFVTIVEFTRNLFTCGAALLATLSYNNLGFVIVNGMTFMAAALLAAWFSAPQALHPAYKYVRLVIRKQWRLILHIKSFLLSCVVMTCENVAVVLTAYAILLQWNIVALMMLVAVAYGAQAVSILCTYGGLQTRCAHLHVETLTLLVASLPGFAVAKQLAVTYAASFATVLIIVAVVELVYGSRFQLVGLLAFQTLPSREVVAVWQMSTLIISTIVPFTVLMLGWTSTTNYNDIGDLLIAVSVCEGVRLLAMLGLWKVHRRENLSTL